MLTQDTDFTCASKNNLYSCAPSTEGAKESYETLQMRLIQVANELATFRSDLPPALDALTVDGIMNATTALGAQTIIGIFAQTVPPPDTLTPMLTVGVSAQELITLAAERSDLILAYIDGTIATAPQVVAPPVAPVGWQMPSLKTIGIGLGVVGVVVGAVLYQRYTDRRDAGIEDNSDLFLPPGDGDDETDDDFDEDDGFDDFIEAEGVEVVDDDSDDDHDADSDDGADSDDSDDEETDDEADLDEGEAEADDDAELEDDIDDAA